MRFTDDDGVIDTLVAVWIFEPLIVVVVLLMAYCCWITCPGSGKPGR